MQIRVNVNDDLVNTISAGIRVFVTRDSKDLDERMIVERARNIAQTLCALDVTGTDEENDQ